MADHLTKEEFWLEFYGLFNRDLGNPERRFCNDCTLIPQFVEDCANAGKPAFISVQPKKDKNTIVGIEKLFFDFDYSNTNQSLSEQEVEEHKRTMETEVKLFLKHLDDLNIKPLVVKTCKGYHVYVYLNSVYGIGKGQTELAKKIYKQLQLSLLQGYDYKYIDYHVVGDINRLCRIPLSIHQKTGEECIIVNNQLKQEKIRSIEFFKIYGLKEADVRATLKKLVNAKKANHYKPINRQPSYQLNQYNVTFKEVRPCFRKAMEAGEMVHLQRLALLQELYAIGHQDPEAIIDVFRCFNDFNESITSYQVNWFFNNVVGQDKIRRYSCNKIKEHGWCLEGNCSLYRRS
jgi:hypothetical protein